MRLGAELFVFGKSYPLYEGPIWEKHILVWDVLVCCKQSLSLLGSFIFMFLLRKPSVLFAFPVILSMWEFQDRPDEMSTTKYLALVTASRTCPCR